MRRFEILVGGAILLACAGCAAGTGSGGATDTFAADLRDAAGSRLAIATLRQSGTDLNVRIEATGLQPGSYAAHIHMVGRCDPPDFTSAGSHWNPTGRQHGKDNPAGNHKGDLPNLMVGADGQGSFEFTVSGVRARSGEGALLDGDGAAVVVHAKPDDYRTDPTGNAGGRLACGVVAPSY
ncbi:superoxide dismutase family protein [Sphingosinicella rhizophila]|uniref:Superoxide dismutase [Cu-Zn] n=1 Tax=Sphingosinicella rhizophila TaxID=3050082 RepID=A0ABU3Q4U3_9SPHN|nr:superoxide dismutase family protein [Sphingosinicella sp. GR2756]MDT9598307.1 superoxide dismutase family protein [Sphingosinicella sp. GR2756]